MTQNLFGIACNIYMKVYKERNQVGSVQNLTKAPKMA